MSTFLVSTCRRNTTSLFPKVRPFLCFGKEKEWSEKNYSILSSHDLTDRTAILYTPSLPHLYIFPEDCAGGACKGFAGRKPGPGTAALWDRHSTGRWAGTTELRQAPQLQPPLSHQPQVFGVRLQRDAERQAIGTKPRFLPKLSYVFLNWEHWNRKLQADKDFSFLPHRCTLLMP